MILFSFHLCLFPLPPEGPGASSSKTHSPQPNFALRLSCLRLLAWRVPTLWLRENMGGTGLAFIKGLWRQPVVSCDRHCGFPRPGFGTLSSTRGDWFSKCCRENI